MKQRLTKRTAESIPRTEKGQKAYWDTKIVGFGVVAGRKKRSYVARATPKGHSKVKQVTLGTVGLMDHGEAERAAQAALADMASGNVPETGRAKVNTDAMTLRKARAIVEEEMRRAGRSPRTINALGYETDLYLPDWLDRPLAEITPRMARERHNQIGRDRGEVTANRVMRGLRRCWRRAAKEEPTLGFSPTDNVNWFDEQRRERAIPWRDLPEWYARVAELSPVRRDLYLMMMFSGLRSLSARTLTWGDVDWRARTLRVRNAKGKEFTLPLSDHLLRILRRRYQGDAAWDDPGNTPFFGDTEWIFPTRRTRKNYGEVTHLQQPREKGLPEPHACRATYITAAEYGARLTTYQYKLLVNHGVRKNDVTGGYIAKEVEHLRTAQEAVSAHLWMMMTAVHLPDRVDVPDHQRDLRALATGRLVPLKRVAG
jgi:integrase